MIEQNLSASDDRWRQPQFLTALIVDIHSFTAMCRHSRAEGLARFMRDVFAGAVEITEAYGGLVANTMGDGILSLFETADAAFASACAIVQDVGNQNEFLLARQSECHVEPYVDNLRCRCALESGSVEHHPLQTKGRTFAWWVGNAINYAARILNAEERACGPGTNIFNTIVLGPTAYNAVRKRSTGFLSPVRVVVKNVEYVAHPFDTLDLYNL
jgi:class 3 adenylate cyclase